MLSQVFLLLAMYQLKHFLADYPLQLPWMLGKFKAGWAFVKPLSSHCVVHAYFTFLISALFLAAVHGPGYGPLPFYLAAFDFVVHFIMDRIKASPSYLGRFEALSKKEMTNILSYVGTLGEDGVREYFGHELRSNRFFWWSLGIDQGVHHLTHYAIIYWLVTA
jgi:hypothetical protein